MELTTDNLIELFGALSGLIFLYLEIKQHPAMWIVGILTSLLYLFVFFNAKFYADAGLQGYYLIVSFYGLWLWQRSRKEQRNEGQNSESIRYRRLNLRLGVSLLLISLLLFAVLHWGLARFTDSPVPMGDAFTTALSLVGTWMLAKRIIEQWYFWMVVNAVSVYLYWTRGLEYTTLLYGCYGIFAVVGLYTWKRKGIKL